MTVKKNDISIRSDYVNDILSQPPGWIYKWGIMTIISALAICILSASIIEYSEKITERVIVQAINIEKTKIYIGKVKIPIRFAREIKIGMPASITLDEFPENKYGLLKGTVFSSKYSFSQNNYIVLIYLTQDGYYSELKNYQSQHYLSGKTEITKNTKSILKRFFEGLSIH